MTAPALTIARWVAVPVAAILGATVVQVIFQGLDALVCAALGACGTSATWAAKAVASIFMGAAFVESAWWTAPTSKHLASLVAFGAVLIWGGTLIVGAFERGFFVWLFAMGAAGIAGGALAVLLGQRRHVASV